MKLVKNLLFAAILVSSMAVSTPAGEQQTPAFICTPTATDNCQKLVATDDSDPKDTGDVAPETTDYLLFEALAALLSVY